MSPLTWYELHADIWVLGYNIYNWQDPMITITYCRDTERFVVTRNQTNVVIGSWDTLEEAQEYSEQVLLPSIM